MLFIILSPMILTVCSHAARHENAVFLGLVITF